MKVALLTTAALTMAGVFLAACGEDTRPLEVIVLEFPDRPPLFEPADYERHIFSTDGTYRTTPKGNPIYGSAREWFRFQSGGRFDIDGEVHTRKYVAKKKWAEVAPTSAEATASSGYWTMPIRQAALEVLGRSSDGPDEAHPDFESLVIIHNAGPPAGEGIAWTRRKVNVIEINGLRKDGDIQDLGIFTHEIGHMLMDQPDRYLFEHGMLLFWDNMAHGLGHFPTGYTGTGRVDSGWAHWEGALREKTEEDTTLPPLETLDTLSRYRGRLGSSYFARKASLLPEYRVPQKDGDRTLDLPAEGVLLFERDEIGTWVEDTDGKDLSERARTFPKRPLGSLVTDLTGTHLPDNRRWALPDGPIDGFTCENGASLNILGECLWDFRDIRIDGEKATFTAEWKVGTGAQIPAGSFPKRLYFRARGPFQATISGIPLMDVPSTAKVLQFSIDLDNFPQGGSITFAGTGASTVSDLAWTERSLSTGQEGLLQPGVTLLGDGETAWVGEVARLHSSMNGSVQAQFDLSIGPHVPKNPENQMTSFTIREGILRLVLAFAPPKGGFQLLPYEGSSALGFLEERIRVLDDPLFYVIQALGGSSSSTEVFDGWITADRKHPFVVMTRTFIAAETGKEGQVLPVIVERTKARSNADLVILAAEFVPLIEPIVLPALSAQKEMSRKMEFRQERRLKFLLNRTTSH